MEHAELGRLDRDRHGDLWTLIFTRRLAHPPEKVWRAVTEPQHLAAWFPSEIVGELRAGAPLRFVTGKDGLDGFDGEMLVFDPPSVMELMWGTDRLRIELQPDGPGTLLTLTDTLSELGKAARDGAGWHECLDRLAASLDGTPLPLWGNGWDGFHADYVERFGPAASTIGPPEGWEDEMNAAKSTAPNRTTLKQMVFVITTPEALWQALVDPELTLRYWGHRNVSGWAVGDRWEHQRADGHVDGIGTIVEIDPPRRLVHTWEPPDDDADPGRISRVSFELETVGGYVRLTLTHDDLPEDELDDTIEGWGIVLSSLKSFVESGQPLTSLL